MISCKIFQSGYSKICMTFQYMFYIEVIELCFFGRITENRGESILRHCHVCSFPNCLNQNV